MNRRELLKKLGIVIAAPMIPKVFFDIGAAWQKHESLYLPDFNYTSYLYSEEIIRNYLWAESRFFQLLADAEIPLNRHE